MPLHNQNTDFLDPIQIQNIDFIVRLGPSTILGEGGWWGIEKCQAPSSHTYTHTMSKNGVNDTVCLVVHKKSYMQKCTSIKKMHGCIIIRVIELFFDLFCTFCTYDFFTAIPVVQKQYQTFVTLRFPFFRLFLLICRRWS